MTRDKAINILASLAGGATQPSWEEIRKAAQFAFDVLSASPEDGVHIQFNDERTFKKEQPKGLDEAAEEIVRDWLAYGNGEYKKLVIAGTKWMAGQGYTKEAMVYVNRLTDVNEVTVLLGWGEPERGGFNPGDKVVVQIRKK